MSNTRTAIRKGAIIFVLVLFLGFTAMSAVMYLASPSQKEMQAEANCISNGFERNSQNKVCLDGLSGEIVDPQLLQGLIPGEKKETQEDCVANSGTRYAENEVCIK